MARGSGNTKIRIIVAIVDLLLINMSFVAAVFLYCRAQPENLMERELWLAVNVAALPLLKWFSGDRHWRRAITMEREMLNALRGVSAHAAVFLALVAFLRISVLPLKWYVAFYSIMVVSLMLWRLAASQYIKHMRKHGRNSVSVIIVGTTPTARRLYSELMSDEGFGYRIHGFFGKAEPGFDGEILGDIDDIADFVKEHSVDQIFFALAGNNVAIQKVIKVADDNMLEFYYIPQLSRFVSRRFQLYSVGAVPMLGLRRNPLSKAHNRMIKRAFDVAVSIVVLLFFYPFVYLPVGLIIKLTSPGPIFFKQERTGFRGKPFKCYKFRSMRVNNDSDRAQATADDPRKTAFGNFLRRSSIDELPQFINVLRGEMSIVGPRPHMLKHTADYSKLIDKYMLRHVVKPGITGWAQVNGYRGLTDELWKMERRVEYDVWYIEHWTFLLDIKIIIRTIMNAVKGEKNAF